MKVLIDHNLTRLIRRFLPGHLVRSTAEEGWERLANGELLRVASQAGYSVLITADQGIYHQNYNPDRTISLVVLTANRKPYVLQQGERIHTAVERSYTGSYVVVGIPVPAKKPYSQP